MPTSEQQGPVTRRNQSMSQIPWSANPLTRPQGNRNLRSIFPHTVSTQRDHFQSTWAASPLGPSLHLPHVSPRRRIAPRQPTQSTWRRYVETSWIARKREEGRYPRGPWWDPHRTRAIKDAVVSHPATSVIWIWVWHTTKQILTLSRLEVHRCNKWDAG